MDAKEWISGERPLLTDMPVRIRKEFTRSHRSKEKGAPEIVKVIFKSFK